MNAHRKIKIGVIGVGIMGRSHVKDIAESDWTELAGICDSDPQKVTTLTEQYGCPGFEKAQAFLDQVQPEGVVIATPHYAHPPLAMLAFERGVHVLVEKPIAVQAKDARAMIQAYDAAQQRYPGLVFAAMFMQRTYGFWQKIKALIDEGALGRLVRTTWIITDWFRPQAYYDHGGWRASWRGEGGGVLLNQCPHNLDLYQWFVGMPSRVTGFASIGKYHRIEVEDEVTAYFEYDNGMIGHFMTTTAESPGTNRLEIVGEYGKLVFENKQLTFAKNQVSMFTQIATSAEFFAKAPHEVRDVPYEHHGQPGHKIIIENFARAIGQDEPLIAPAPEGLNSVMLGNAIMLSSFLQKAVEIPIDEDAYDQKLQALIQTSKFQG